MRYEGNVIRPPSEADAIILQVTVGCSHNRCTFCGAYRSVAFRIRSLAEIDADLRHAARLFPEHDKIFLADGDVLSLSMRRLREILALVRQHLPGVRKIGLYGNAKNIRHKSRTDLAELRAAGLKRVYMGLESGDPGVLERVGKGVTPGEMVDCAEKIRAAGLFLSVTALLGLGGRTGSRRHAEATAGVLRAMHPSQIALLSLMPIPGTPLAGEIERGAFQLPAAGELLLELRHLLAGLAGVRCQFHCNHASNHLPLAGRLPQDHARLLATVDRGLAGAITLMPEDCRRL
ncbi:MAG: radical SAM protein [Thermodesulfobacteriota bacterium]